MHSVIFRTYIAGNSPNSLRAVERLKRICARHFQGKAKIEVVDVLREPARALEDSVFVTPTVIRASPGPRRVLIGDLSDEEQVLSLLRV